MGGWCRGEERGGEWEPGGGGEMGKEGGGW